MVVPRCVVVDEHRMDNYLRWVARSLVQPQDPVVQDRLEAGAGAGQGVVNAALPVPMPVTPSLPVVGPSLGSSTLPSVNTFKLTADTGVGLGLQVGGQVDSAPKRTGGGASSDSKEGDVVQVDRGDVTVAIVHDGSELEVLSTGSPGRGVNSEHSNPLAPPRTPSSSTPSREPETIYHTVV